MPSVNIGNFIQTIMGGNAQGVRQTQHSEVSKVVNDPDLLTEALDVMGEKLIDAVKADLPGSHLRAQLALEERGLSVTTAGEGVSAIALMQDERPAAIVLDLTLPGTDGLAVAEAVHRVHGEDVPILVVTADGNAREKASAIGAVGYLGEPFDIDELTQS